MGGREEVINTSFSSIIVFYTFDSQPKTCSKDSVCLFSYNSRGFTEEKQDICRMLFMNNTQYFPILCGQETFLLKGNSYKISQCLPNARIIFKKAEKDSFEGRPKNGMFIAIPRELNELVRDVSPQHWRIQAVVLSASHHRLLIINSYFPTDPRVADFDSTDLYSTLAAIGSVMDDNEFDSIVWMGDINADFERNSTFTKTVAEFIEERRLVKSWEKHPIDHTHVYEKEGMTYTSTIDHIFWSENMCGQIQEADVLHMPNNLSDHSPIFCKVKIENITVTNIQEKQNKSPKINWNKASGEDIGNYKCLLTRKLASINYPTALMECSDPHCKDEQHVHSCDTYILDILEAVKSAATESLPSTGVKSGRKKPLIMNWKEEIEPFREKACFWSAVWKSAGKPQDTELHKVMKRARNIYHLHIRKSRRAAELLKKNSLLEACISDRGDIFKEIRKLRRASPATTAAIDGVTSNIESHFADVYDKLYNSVEDTDDLKEVKEYLNKNITERSLTDVNVITPELVGEAISLLKNDKTDPVFVFNSNCLKNAPRLLSEHLASLFRSLLIHGHISPVVLVSTIVPLVKDKLGDVNSSNNYRSIALSNLILKVFDWVVILAFDENLRTDDLQFGYQKRTSTTMCTWLAVETIDHFMRSGSEVFVGVMDMSKAFDNVKQSSLFWQLIKRDFPPIYIRLILVMYSQQSANVLWNGQTSKDFSIGNGVKQGGVLSPRLFCIYIDGLFKFLRRKKTGCWLHKEFVGILGYADDLLLLAPSRDALQEMISNCGEFAEKLNLTFSTHDDPRKSKTKCMAFLKRNRELKNVKLHGKDLPWVKAAKHLGCKVTDERGSLRSDLMEKRAVYINKVNELSQEFHYAHPSTKVRINNIFNTHFYGSPLWDLFGKEADRLEKTWNVSQRIMLGLPRQSHRYFIEPLSGARHIRFSLFERYIQFVKNIEMSDKKVLRKTLSVMKRDCRSTTGGNLRNLMKITGNTSIHDIKVGSTRGLIYKPIPDGEDWKVNIAKDLIDMKSGRQGVDLTKEEVEEMLHVVTT